MEKIDDDIIISQYFSDDSTLVKVLGLRIEKDA